MAVTLSEQEKQALNDVFISMGQKKSFLSKITNFIGILFAYIFKLKRNSIKKI
jgi:uncharacterized membrane protein